MSEARESFADVGKLKQALVAFLATDQSDWRAISRELAGLAAATPEDQQQEDREAWLLLADYLAHADRAAGVPLEVRRLLDSDEAARAAEAAFNETMTQRQAWLDFARRSKPAQPDR